MNWLVASIVLSIVLTVALNVVLRAFPRTGDRAAEHLDHWMRRDDPDDRRVRVFFPWRAMLVGSIVLTVLVNLVLWFK